MESVAVRRAENEQYIRDVAKRYKMSPKGFFAYVTEGRAPQQFTSEGVPIKRWEAYREYLTYLDVKNALDREEFEEAALKEKLAPFAALDREEKKALEIADVLADVVPNVAIPEPPPRARRVRRPPRGPTPKQLLVREVRQKRDNECNKYKGLSRKRVAQIQALLE